MAKPPVWNTKRPAAKPAKKLSPGQILLAKARAEAAGHRYPNLVDNMWAAKQNA
ncbi:MAG TPA: hypothetical protein VGC41_11565 [Kofleriaceae bacterium]